MTKTNAKLDERLKKRMEELGEDDARVQLDQLEDDIEDKDEEIEFLKSDLKEAKKKMAELKTGLKVSKEKVSHMTKLEAKLTDVEAEVQTTEQRNQNFAFEKRRMTQRIDRLEE